jgi:hypothetical protein
MKTVEQILKETGLSDEQIKALDPKVVTGFTTVVTSASQSLEAAELAKRAQEQQYSTEIAPALDNWANEKASYDAKIAAYDAALKAAKEGGFQVPDILAAKPAEPARTADGKFVAGQNQVPGSPQLVENLKNELSAAFQFTADTTHRYRTLYGTEMPDSPTTIIREATAQRMSPSEYAAKKYNFAQKEQEIAAEKQKKHDDAIVAAALAENDKKWSEKVGSNPMIRQAEASKFSNLDKAVKAGERHDPLKMTREQRHEATRQSIMKEINEHQASVN